MSLSNKKKPGLLGEEADPRAGAKEVQDEPETSCQVRTKDVLIKGGRYVQRTQAPTQDAPNGQSQNNLSNKIQIDSFGL